MTSNNWAETVLIAGAAAAVVSWVMLQWADRERNNNPTPPMNPHQSLFPQNAKAATMTQQNTTITDHGGVTTGGWSMKDAMEAAKKESEAKATMTPAEVLRSLQKGNSRFWSGQASRPEKSAFERRALILKQFPLTAVLGCSDSRVPVEIVFDQGLGDMFVVRVAGNCLGPTTEGSLEYAVHKLNVKVLLVMGHEGCGAIKAATLPLERINQEPAPLASLLRDIKSGLDSSHLCQIIDARARDREAVATNVKNQVIKLAEDPQILARINEGKLKVVGAFYEISSGIVDFFMQVAKDQGGEFKPSPGVQSRYNPKTKEIVYA